MQTQTLYRLSGISALLGGLVDMGAHAIPHTANSAPLEAYYAAADILLMFGIFGLYLAHAQKTGILGLIGFIIAATGIGSIIGPDAIMFDTNFYEVGISAVTIGLLIYSIVLLRAKILTPSAIAWLLMAVIGIGGSVLGYAISFKIAGLLFGLGFVLGGWKMVKT